jgi:hypothetical protein
MAFSFRDREAHPSGAPPRVAVVSDCDIGADARTGDTDAHARATRDP